MFRRRLYELRVTDLLPVAMDQYVEIISANDAWLIADEQAEEEETVIDRALKPTNSARRVKALVEQVTGHSPFNCWQERN